MESQKGLTPLHLAATNGHHEVIRVLVKDLGADVDSKDKDALTPLHCAAERGCHEAVRVLGVELGANVTFSSCRTPLHLAAEYGHIHVRGDRLKAIRVLVDGLGADIDALADGCTALDLAALNADSEAIRLLKEFGAQ